MEFAKEYALQLNRTLNDFLAKLSVLDRVGAPRVVGAAAFNSVLETKRLLHSAFDILLKGEADKKRLADLFSGAEANIIAAHVTFLSAFREWAISRYSAIESELGRIDAFPTKPQVKDVFRQIDERLRSLVKFESGTYKGIDLVIGEADEIQKLIEDVGNSLTQAELAADHRKVEASRSLKIVLFLMVGIVLALHVIMFGAIQEAVRP